MKDSVVGVVAFVAADRVLADEHVVEHEQLLFDVVVVVVVADTAAAVAVAADLTSYFLDYSTPYLNFGHNAFHQLEKTGQ